MLLPIEGFPDDLKFVADFSLHTKAEVQSEINKVAIWAEFRRMPLSKKKLCYSVERNSRTMCILYTMRSQCLLIMLLTSE